MTDKEIIDKVLRGDTTAFGLLVEKYQSMVFRTAIGFVHVREDAEDIAQDVFMKIYQSLQSYHGDAEFSTWIYRITINTCINSVNKKRYKTFMEYAGELFLSVVNKATKDANPEQQCIELENESVILRAIDSLPEKQRTAFILSKFDDLPQKEIASIMQTSEGAVEQLLQRAKNNLLKKVTPIVGK